MRYKVFYRRYQKTGDITVVPFNLDERGITELAALRLVNGWNRLNGQNGPWQYWIE